MRTHFKEFKSSTKFWTTMFEEAAEFASTIGQDRLITITQSCDHNTAVIVVWYWDK